MYEAGGEGKPIENLEKKELVLEEGEIICDRCNGTGDAGDNQFPGAWRSWEPTCNKCWGAGKLNWIENVFGKDCPGAFSGTSGTFGSSSGVSGTSSGIGKSGIPSVHHKFSDPFGSNVTENNFIPTPPPIRTVPNNFIRSPVGPLYNNQLIKKQSIFDKLSIIWNKLIDRRSNA